MEKETLERLKKDQQEFLAILDERREKRYYFLYIVKNIFIFLIPAILYCVVGSVIGFKVTGLIVASIFAQVIMIIAFCEGASENMFDPED